LLAILSGHTEEEQSIADRIVAEEAAATEDAGLLNLPVDAGDAAAEAETVTDEPVVPAAGEGSAASDEETTE
jgi:hypothetical protein